MSMIIFRNFQGEAGPRLGQRRTVLLPQQGGRRPVPSRELWRQNVVLRFCGRGWVPFHHSRNHGDSGCTGFRKAEAAVQDESCLSFTGLREDCASVGAGAPYGFLSRKGGNVKPCKNLR